LEFSASEVRKFVFGFCLMSHQFLVFQVVPHFLVGVPVWRVFWKMENVKSLLAINEGFCFSGCVRWSLIHNDYKMAAAMMHKHLIEEGNDLR